MDDAGLLDGFEVCLTLRQGERHAEAQTNASDGDKHRRVGAGTRGVRQREHGQWGNDNGDSGGGVRGTTDHGRRLERGHELEQSEHSCDGRKEAAVAVDTLTRVAPPLNEMMSEARQSVAKRLG